MSTTRFGCDYAKRISSCKKCKLQLPKGEIRLCKITPNPFVQNPDGPPPDMKAYFHPLCLFETFMKARATTKVIEEPGDIEGWGDMTAEDKAKVTELIDDLEKTRGKKNSGGKGKTPKKEAKTPATPTASSSRKKKGGEEVEDEGTTAKVAKKEEVSTPKTGKKDVKIVEKAKQETKETSDFNEKSKFNSFQKFCKLCDIIGSVSAYTEKSNCVRRFVTMADYTGNGDMLTLVRLLIPGIDQRVYNMKEKQLIKHFAQIYNLCHEELMEDYNNSGDVSQTIREAVEKNNLSKVQKSDWSIQKVDRFLTKLTEMTKDEEQISHLKFAAKRLSPLELQYLLRLIKKDLRFNAGTKHILDGIHHLAYQAFQNCRDLADIMSRVSSGTLKEGEDGIKGDPIFGIKLGVPVLPMLAEACKSVEFAMKRCPNGMYAEIKYDGERVQLHKKGEEFSFYSRSLKPVQSHKVSHLSKYIPQAFPDGTNLVLDAEVLMVDTNTGKPLPFGTLGIHKRENFKDAAVCLFIFDILLYNDYNLQNTPLKERKAFLEKTVKEVPNRVMLSNYQIIGKKEHAKLKTMIWKAIDEGLEGLVMKDLNGIYEPGKRHWLKVKKDYLEEGKMADTADLIVLGAYYGTGNKGGMMSVFLMGVYDKDTKTYRTVTKCGNGHTDEALEKINKKLEKQMTKIYRDHTLVPKWLKCSRGLCPDFVIVDPKEAPVWEITGAEFSRSDNHTASGISIRFPRVTRVREDKDAESATSLAELRKLFDASKEKSDIDREDEDSVPLYAKDEKSLGGSLHEEVKKNESVPDPFVDPLEDNGEKEEKKTTKRKSEREEPRKTKKTKVDSDCESDGEENGATTSREQEESESAEKKEERGTDGRPKCKYGQECFRKNKEHNAEFWHPHK